MSFPPLCPRKVFDLMQRAQATLRLALEDAQPAREALVARHRGGQVNGVDKGDGVQFGEWLMLHCPSPSEKSCNSPHRRLARRWSECKHLCEPIGLAAMGATVSASPLASAARRRTRWTGTVAHSTIFAAASL